MVTGFDPREVEAANEKATAEWARFEEHLPHLLEDPVLRGRWVVFLGGEVRAVFDDRLEARRWAVGHLGKYAGFVMARVEPQRIIRIPSFVAVRR